jgi:hypothetical protein
MNLKSRVQKIEQQQKSTGFVIIAVEDGETNEQAYQRCFANDTIKPNVVIYATALDVLL